MARKHHAPWRPSAADRAVAAALARPGAELAWLPLGSRVLYTSVTPVAHAPRTAVLDLVQAVWERMPDQAHAVLRERIRTTSAPSDLDRAVVRVAAKRCTFDLEPEPGPCPEAIDLAPHAAAARGRARGAALSLPPGDVDWPAWLTRVARSGPEPLTRRDRPVAAVLLDAAGRPLAAAHNASGANRTLHAEVCLLQSLGRPLPPGATVFVGLQPCRMCAALLVHCATGPLDVRYVQPDPGPLARATALQTLGWERPC